MAVSSQLSEVREVLQKRLALVADRAFYAADPAGHLAALQAISARLTELVQALPPDTDPQLRHFLERQSYVKALDFLQSQLGKEDLTS